MAERLFVLDTEMTQLADKIREKNNTTGLLSWPQGFIDAYNNTSSLNFEVVGGTTQPTSPKENTIWVNTGTNITSWIFSTTEPTALVEGMIWFETSSGSLTPFNCLFENSLYVYPNRAWQYINGAWEEKTTMVYQNEAWNSFWDGTLYRAGDQYENVTGGWNAYKWKYTASTGSTLGTLTFLADQIYISSAGMTYDTGWAISTVNKINLTDYNTLTFTGTFSNNSLYAASYYRAFVASDRSSPWVNAEAFAMSPGVTANFGSFIIDISSLEGEYYIGMGLYINEGDSISSYIDNIYLSK